MRLQEKQHLFPDENAQIPYPARIRCAHQHPYFHATGAKIDTTERITLERKLLEQAAELVVQNQRKDQFLAMLGHELRNPLASIRSIIETFKLRLDALEPEFQTGIDIIDRQASDLKLLADDIMDMARIVQGELRLDKSAVNLTAVVNQSVTIIQPRITHRRQRLDVSLPNEPLQVRGDPARLVQVLNNLFDNASKFTANGGRLAVSLQRKGEHAVMRVRDSGIGIHEAQRRQLFKPFPAAANAPKNRAASGLGVGLALCKWLVEQHEGSIGAFSEGSGKGSVFTVRLPVMAATDRLTLSAAQTDQDSTATVSRRILLVEDDEANRVAMAELLKTMGHEVETADRGEVVPDQVAAFQPEVILLDIELPDISGREVARRLRARFPQTQWQLIALSGYSPDKNESGFDRYLIKPVTIDILKQALAPR